LFLTNKVTMIIISSSCKGQQDERILHKAFEFLPRQCRRAPKMENLMFNPLLIRLRGPDYGFSKFQHLSGLVIFFYS